MNASNTVRIDAVLSLAESRGLLKVLLPSAGGHSEQHSSSREAGRTRAHCDAGAVGWSSDGDLYRRLPAVTTVTPQITSENTIFLIVDVENTTAELRSGSAGQPGTDHAAGATTQVLVNPDGGTVVIGGVIQTQNSVSIDQAPLLGNIAIR